MNLPISQRKDSSMPENFWLLNIEIARLCSDVYVFYGEKQSLNWTKQIICDLTDLSLQFLMIGQKWFIL